MKIIGISGSPKLTGFTNLLLNKAMEGASSCGAETEIIMLNQLEFDPCQECRSCSDTGQCVLSDGMSHVYKKILSADGLIVVSPIYFGTVSAQLKMMIDRLMCIWNAKYMLKKKITGCARRKGIFICIAGENKNEYFESAKKVVKMMFATINVEYAGDLFVGGMDNIGPDSPKRKAFIDKVFSLGGSLVQTHIG
jgi:putative NADPH-quinone reductase